MKVIKSFEAFAGYPIPTTSLDVELEYKICKDCDSLYSIYKPKSINCKYCGSKDLQNLTEGEYYDKLQFRLSPDEFKNALENRERIKNTFIDLTKSQDDWIN